MAVKKAKKGSYRMTSFMVEPEIYDEFIEVIPRSKSVGEALREYMQTVVAEQKKELDLNSPNYSAIGSIGNISKQSTLDKYFPGHIQDWQTFKTIIDQLPDDERKKLTEIWLHDFRILEASNHRKTGSKVYPFLKV